MWIFSFFIAKLPEKAKNIEILLRFQRWMKKTNILRVRSVLSWTSGAFDSETETGISESQEAIDDFINQQKSANTNKKKVTDMITLLRYIEANGMKNEKIESLPASELDHYLSKFVWTDGRKTEKNKSQRQSPVSAQDKLTAILRKNIRLTYPRTMSSKNPEKSLQRSSSHLFWHEHGKGNKLQTAEAIDEDEEDALF